MSNKKLINLHFAKNYSNFYDYLIENGIDPEEPVNNYLEMREYLECIADNELGSPEAVILSLLELIQEFYHDL